MLLIKLDTCSFLTSSVLGEHMSAKSLHTQINSKYLQHSFLFQFSHQFSHLQIITN